MKVEFFKQTGTSATLTPGQKVEICKANLKLMADFQAKKEVTFADLKGRTSKVKLGMLQDLPVGTGFEKAKLIGISYAAGADAKTPRFKDEDGDEHLVQNFTGWWAPANGTHFGDGKKERQYSIFTGK